MGEKAFVDFRKVKEMVSMADVLDRYKVRLRKVNLHSMRGKCPLPTHSSEQSSESFGVHLSKNVWACQSTSCASARQGKKGGNVLDFVAVMESCSIRDAALRLQEWFTVNATNAAQSRTAKTQPKNELVAKQKSADAQTEERAVDVNRPLTFTLKNIDHSHPYLQHRGITQEVAEQFGIGYFSGRGSMAGRVVIPIHNREGELVAYAGHATDGAKPKYKFPAGFRKSLELYNLHQVTERERVAVVEGFFDCIKVSAAGFACVALMGSSLSEFHEQALARFKLVTLMLDGDEAGQNAADEIAGRLVRHSFVRIADVGEGRQPDQLPPEEIRSLLV